MRELGTPEKTAQEYFLGNVEKSDDCWEWTGYIGLNGYGTACYAGKRKLAHRFSWEIHNGKVPEENIDHICCNRGCVNPDHLRIANHAQNSQNKSVSWKESNTGFRGIHRDRRNGRYVAYGTVAGKRQHIGSYGTVEEAKRAAVAWRRENMPYSVADQL